MPDNLEALIAKAEAGPIEAERVLDVGDRLTVNVQLYHEQQGQQPLSVPHVFSHMLASQEQPYSRRITVGPNPTSIVDGSWVEQPGMVMIQNNRPTHTRLPSPEVLADEDTRVLYVNDGSGQSIIRPGRCMFFEPSEHDNIYLHAPHGPVQCHLTIFPL